MCAYRVIQEERAIFWDVLVPVIVRKYVDTNMCIILMAAEIQSYQYTTYIYIYTGCHRRNGPNFGRVFLMLNYTDITQNTYTQS